DKAPWEVTLALDKAEVVQGQSVSLTVKQTRHWPDFKGPLLIQGQAQIFGIPTILPQGMNLPQTNLNAGQAEAKMNFNVGTNIPPGTYNLVVRSQSQVQFQRDPKLPAKVNVLAVQPSAPVTLTVLPKTLATVTVQTPQPNVKPGAQTEVVVNLTRQFNYDGEFKLALVLPPGVAGLSADEVTVPAGATQ